MPTSGISQAISVENLSVTTTVQELYGDIWGEDDAAFEARLGQSLDPRGPDVLYDLFATLEPRPDETVLDVGSRDGSYAVELARRFGCRVIAVDPIPRHFERATALVAREGMADRVTVALGGIEALPVGDGAIDHVWCRDVLNHVALAPGLNECARALRTGGGMLVYQTFATEAMEANEARRLYASMAIVPENMAPRFFEKTARDAGFEIVARDAIDSEWRERWVEEGKRDLLDDLLRIARLRRLRAELVAQFGEARYEAAYGGNLWGIYQMLGKLRPTVYLLRKP
jgi:sarcosine/dimethylglycine N-methyltransferase